jgi:hypothetical protein
VSVVEIGFSSLTIDDTKLAALIAALSGFLTP